MVLLELVLRIWCANLQFGLHLFVTAYSDEVPASIL